mgnify:CR=1 FL=1
MNWYNLPSAAASTTTKTAAAAAKASAKTTAAHAKARATNPKAAINSEDNYYNQNQNYHPAWYIFLWLLRREVYNFPSQYANNCGCAVNNSTFNIASPKLRQNNRLNYFAAKCIG